MTVRLVTYTPNPEEVLIEAFSQCYQLQVQGKKPDVDVVIRNLKHQSVLEHVSYTFEASLSRSALMQLTRHRIGISLSVESQRYVGYNDGFEYYIPEEIDSNPEALKMYKAFHDLVAMYYNALRKQNIPKEMARYVLPNSVLSHFVFTMNLRSLIHFWELRLDKKAQKEIRTFAFKTLTLVLETIPNLSPEIKMLVFGDKP